MILEDGKGTGYKAEVNHNHHLVVEAIIVTEDHHANHQNGKAYNILVSQSPTAADDCIFYMSNTDSLDLIVEGITLGFKNAGADDLEFYIKIGDSGTRNNATALTPANLNAGSNETAIGTFEKGADLDGGAATLSGGTEVERWIYAGVQDQISDYINFNQDIILPKNQTLTLWATDSSATYYAILPFYIHE